LTNRKFQKSTDSGFSEQLMSIVRTGLFITSRILLPPSSPREIYFKSAVP
jgi:hypothetical protein